MNLTTIKSAFGTKLVAGLVAVVMTVPAFVGFAHTANAATDVEGLCALAKSLGISSAQFSAVCGGGSTVTVTNTTATTSSAGRTEYTYHPSIAFMFDRNLNIGDKGNDVKVLQQILNSDPATAIAAGPGSRGQESTYYGQKTRAAVAKWQAKYGVSPALGNFYTLTREKMNTTRFVPGTVTTTRPATNNNVSTNDRNDRNDRPSSNGGGDGDIDVSETNSADDGILSPGMTRFLALSFDVSATSDATINGITIEYDGRPDEDDIIENVVLADSDGNILAEDEDFDSDSEAEFNNLDLDIDRGDDMEIFVYVNAVTVTGDQEFDGNSDGQDFEISVIAIDADGDVDGLPLTGPEHEVEDDDLGDVKVDIDNEGGSIEIGEENELFATIEIESDTEDSDDVVYIKSLRLENIGSGDLEEIDDLVAELDNKTYEGTIDPRDDDFVIFHFGKDGYELENGDSEDIDIRGTILDDAGDDYAFSVADDETYNIHVEHEDGYGMPIDIRSDNSGSTKTSVTAADLTFATSDDDESDEVSVGDDIFLGEFEVDIDGEGVDIDELVLLVEMRTASVTNGGNARDLLLEDVYIENEDGDRVTSTENADWATNEPGKTDLDNGAKTSGLATQRLEFDNVELEEGDDVTYKVYATIDDNVATGTEYTIVISEADGVEGSQSDEDVKASGLPITLEERDVEGGALAFSISRSPSDRTISDDEDATVFARFEFDVTESGENIDLESFEATLTITNGGVDPTSAYDADVAVERLKNCQLFDEDKDEVELDNDVDGNDGDETSANSGIYEFDFDFKKDLSLESDTITELELRCDIGSLADGYTFQWSVNSNSDVRAEGEETNNNIEATISGANEGGEMTIGSAELQATEDATSPSTQLVVESNEVILGVLELEADDGEVTVEDITVTLTGTNADGTNNTDASQILERERVLVYIVGKEKKGEHIGIASFTSSITDIIEDVDVTIEDDESVELVFKGTISRVGDEEDGANGDRLTLIVESVTPEDDDVDVTGANDGNDASSFADGRKITFDSVVVFETIPAIKEVRFNEENQELTTGDNEMLQFAITADDGDDVTIGQIVLDIDVTGATISTDADAVQVHVASSSSFGNLVPTNDGEFDAVQVGNTDNWVVTFSDDNTDNYLEIPKGDTYYFRVSVDLATAPNGANVRAQINEDNDFSSAVSAGSHDEAAQTTAIAAVTNGTNGTSGNLVWSPSFNTGDVTMWFNAFEVEGIESNIDNSRRHDSN